MTSPAAICRDGHCARGTTASFTATASPTAGPFATSATKVSIESGAETVVRTPFRVISTAGPGWPDEAVRVEGCKSPVIVASAQEFENQIGSGDGEQHAMPEMPCRHVKA